MQPIKPCYRHPGMKDTVVELLSKYPGTSSVTIKVRWWNLNSYYGSKPFLIFPKPSKYKLSKKQWREFEPVNWKKEVPR